MNAARTATVEIDRALSSLCPADREHAAKQLRDRLFYHATDEQLRKALEDIQPLLETMHRADEIDVDIDLVAFLEELN